MNSENNTNDCWWSADQLKAEPMIVLTDFKPPN